MQKSRLLNQNNLGIQNLLQKNIMRSLILTTIAMFAFAANSILCRLALGEAVIDAASFTTIRLCSGAITLALIVAVREPSLTIRRVDNKAALALFCYAICFSFAYIDLTAATGALILFGAVQLTMILCGLYQGERPSPVVWIGIIIAFAGLGYLVLPGVSAPSVLGASLMTIAGIAWGAYSLRGRHTTSPILSTMRNFAAAVPLTLLASLLFINSIHLTIEGATLAVLSGAVASGLGYVIWYAALPYLKPASAATVQLSVPVIAAIGGILFIGEPLTMRLIIAGILILGGIALVIKTKQRKE